HITSEQDMDGLPESVKSVAKEEAEKRGVEGWIFTLQFPSMMPFMKYAKKRNLRKELYLASSKKAFNKNEYDNEECVRKIVALRQERAELLGYETHAHFILEERMA